MKSGSQLGVGGCFLLLRPLVISTILKEIIVYQSIDMCMYLSFNLKKQSFISKNKYRYFRSSEQIGETHFNGVIIAELTVS